MSALLLPGTITAPAFETCRTRYDETVSALSASLTAAAAAGPSLEELDGWRRAELPALVAARSPPHLIKDELAELLQCKLKRGKFRPLKALVDSNDAKAVEKATSAALSRLSDAPDQQSILAALKDVSALRGVGPATASYVLAAFRPRAIPVFSDEGFRWALYEDSPGKRWDRKLKYDAKEYAEYLVQTRKIAERLGVSVEDVEMVGYVLGREAVLGKTGATKKRNPAAATLKDKEPVPAKRAREPEEMDEANTKKRAPPKQRRSGKPNPPPSGRTLRSSSSKQHGG